MRGALSKLRMVLGATGNFVPSMTRLVPSNLVCFLMVDDTAGSDDFKSVKGDLEKGMEVLEKELALFEVMLQQKKLI